MLEILVIIWLCFMGMVLIGFLGSWIAQKFVESLLDIFIWMLSIGAVGTVIGFIIWFIVEFIIMIIGVL